MASIFDQILARLNPKPPAATYYGADPSDIHMYPGAPPAIGGTPPVYGGADQNVPDTMPMAPPHRKGIVGALQSVFAPDPSSWWAGALRNGVWHASDSQEAYRRGQETYSADTALKKAQTAEATAKAENEAKKNKYVVVGNNVLDPETGSFLPVPQTEGDKEKLIDRWHAAQQAGDAKTASLIEHMLLAGNSPDVIDYRERTKAKYRAPPRAAASVPGLPPGFVIGQ